MHFKNQNTNKILILDTSAIIHNYLLFSRAASILGSIFSIYTVSYVNISKL